MTNVINMRKENQEDFQNRYSIKLGFMSFFVKACVVALKNFPAVNAEIEGDTIVYKNYYNISFAVGTDKGLVVPVLKNADELSFADIEKNIKEISDKAKDVDRPIAVDGEIKIRPIMYLALSYDHRIIDGKESVSFLKMVKENLEDPRRLFLDI